MRVCKHSSQCVEMKAAPLPKIPRVKDRVIGKKYIRKGGKISYWAKGYWRCKHYREERRCKQCGGKGICSHGRIRQHCRECGGKQFCSHKRLRTHCKDCGGSSLCPHRRQKSMCVYCVKCSVCGVLCDGRRMCVACERSIDLELLQPQFLTCIENK